MIQEQLAHPSRDWDAAEHHRVELLAANLEARQATEDYYAEPHSTRPWSYFYFEAACWAARDIQAHALNPDYTDPYRPEAWCEHRRETA